MPEGSAHTIRFSEKTNLFFTSGFEKGVNVWKIDITKDYTRVTKIAAGLKSSVTTMEIFDEFNLLVTIDENGNLRSKILFFSFLKINLNSLKKHFFSLF